MLCGNVIANKTKEIGASQQSFVEKPNDDEMMDKFLCDFVVHFFGGESFRTSRWEFEGVTGFHN